MIRITIFSIDDNINPDLRSRKVSSLNWVVFPLHILYFNEHLNLKIALLTIISVLYVKYVLFQHNMNSYVVFRLCNITVSYSVLNPSSITSLCKCLSMEEAGLFGLQLGLPLSIKDDLINAANPAKELAFRLLGIWSGSKHSSRRVRKYVWFWYNLVLTSKIY